MPIPLFEQWAAREVVPPVDVPTSNVAVLVVDMQNLMLESDSPLTAAGFDVAALRPSIPGCQRLVALARAAGHPVIFIRIIRMPDEAERKRTPRLHSYRYQDVEPVHPVEWESEIIAELPLEPGDYLLDKPFGSSFVATRTEALLTGLGITDLVVCGTTTNMCVENSARHASELGLGTYVVRDAVGEFEKSRGEHSLYTIDTTFGRVVTTDDVARSWAHASAALVDA